MTPSYGSLSWATVLLLVKNSDFFTWLIRPAVTGLLPSRTASAHVTVLRTPCSPDGLASLLSGDRGKPALTSGSLHSLLPLCRTSSSNFPFSPPTLAAKHSSCLPRLSGTYQAPSGSTQDVPASGGLPGPPHLDCVCRALVMLLLLSCVPSLVSTLDRRPLEVRIVPALVTPIS